MKYDNITRATFIKRPNRFIAEVDIDGHRETVHVKNTGRCKELLIPGCEVWLTAPGTPDRKTKYDLVAVRKDNGVLFNIDSQASNKVVKEWLATQGYDLVIPGFHTMTGIAKKKGRLYAVPLSSSEVLCQILCLFVGVLIEKTLNSFVGLLAYFGKFISPRICSLFEALLKSLSHFFHLFRITA